MIYFDGEKNGGESSFINAVFLSLEMYWDLVLIRSPSGFFLQVEMSAIQMSVGMIAPGPVKPSLLK